MIPSVLHLFGLRYRYVAVLAVLVLILLAWCVSWIARIVTAVTMAGVPNCPGCASTDVRKTLAKGIPDAVFKLFGCSPYRCGACGNRYFRAT